LVFVSSLAGVRSLQGQGVCGAAKAALNHPVAAAALELGPRNIRVSAVAPGLTRTLRLTAVLGNEKMQTIAGSVPLRRFGYPEDIAAAILFLTSDLARLISGVILPVDGGITNVSVFPALDVGANFLKVDAQISTSSMPDQLCSERNGVMPHTCGENCAPPTFRSDNSMPLNMCWQAKRVPHANRI
jgi:hypothetical protein